VDRSCRHPQVVQEVIEVVNTSLGVAEDEGARRWHEEKKVVGCLFLVVLVAPDDLF
jgi:hypothetical protein